MSRGDSCVSFLPSSAAAAGKLGVDVANDFRPLYVTLPGKQATIKRLIAAAKAPDCAKVVLATDEVVLLLLPRVGPFGSFV